jgi:hypothetical protein
LGALRVAGDADAAYRNKLTLLGIIEPPPWANDGGKRREPVLDTDHSPPKVVRRVGWHRCLRCRVPFFSLDVAALRQCTECRSDDDRHV